MAKLPDLGYVKGLIFETIVSTFNEHGQPNAAPMGTIMENESQIIIKLYNTSLTHSNLQASKCAVINITSNIDLFYKTAFKENNPKGKLPTNWFDKAETVNAPKLKTSEATIEVAVADMKPIDAEKTAAICNVKHIEATKNLPQAYCRAFPATVEAIIHATRIKAFLAGNEKQKAQAKKLMEIIALCHEVVDRTAPNSHYAEIMTDLTRMIDSGRNTKT